MHSTGFLVQTACLWEVSAHKAGDVNRRHDFDTLSFTDFLLSAAAIAPILDAAPCWRLGCTVHDAVAAMRRVVNANPHLGTILLLAPLAAVPVGVKLRDGVEQVLAALEVTDSRGVFLAIRLANPSGLGKAPEQDVAGEPTLPLRDVMALAAHRDLVARQYANGFREVFDEGVPALRHGLERTGSVEGAILHCQLTFLANHPDGLIARKRGGEEATEASYRARLVLDRGWPAPEAWPAWQELDDWLREPGRGRNPGTTADLIVASLFVALREAILTVPSSIPWSGPDRALHA